MACAAGNMTALRRAVLLIACVAAASIGGRADGRQAASDATSVRTSVFVIDLRGNGHEFTSPAQGVVFDMDGGGTPIRTGWTAPQSDDAFLVLDVNGNGRIDSGREIIGSAWVGPDGTRVSGFHALVLIQGFPLDALKNPVPPGLGFIEEEDTVYSRLRLWVDSNHNGVSEDPELQPLGGKVSRISLGFRKLTEPQVDPFNNRITLQGAVTLGPATPKAARLMSYVEFAR